MSSYGMLYLDSMLYSIWASRSNAKGTSEATGHHVSDRDVAGARLLK